MISIPGIDTYLLDPWGATWSAWICLRAALIAWRPVIAAAVVVGVGGVVIGLWYWRDHCQQRLHQGARVVNILLPPRVDPEGAQALWSNLVGLLRPAWARLLSGQPHLVWEYVFDAESTQVQVWVPGTIPPGLVERAVEAAWPGTITSSAPARPPIAISALHGQRIEAAGGELRLARCEALPIRTAFPAETLRSLLAAPASLGPGEQSVVQIIARPVTGARVLRARRAARRLSDGGSNRLAGRLLDVVTPHTGARPAAARPPRDHQASLEVSARDRAIISKTRGPLYETRVRYTVTTTIPAGDQVELAKARMRLRGLAHASAGAFAVFSEHNYYRRVRLRNPLAAVAERRMRRGDLLAVDELACLAHLPSDEATPGLHRAGAKASPPPPGIAHPGPDTKPLGLADAGPRRPVALRVCDARHHLHILGATGAGKSELMARLILADAHAGRGVVVVDPKGDLISDLLARLPEHVASKVVLFDPDERGRPPVLNPLQGGDSAQVVENLVSVFSRVYAAGWGPRTDDILRAALLTLRAQPGVPNLADLPTLLTHHTFRQRAVAHVNDRMLRGFWQWYDAMSDASRAHVTAPLMNKIRGLLLRPFIRDALAGGPSTVDMNAVLDGGICLVRASVGALGVDTARLLGSLIVAQTWQATTRRSRLPQHKRPDAALYLDECQHFLNLPYGIGDMLAEARGYRLSMTLAHQYLAQLPKDLAEGISANARNKVFFTASPEDARRLANHTHPHLSEHDLSHLDAFHAAARLVSDGGEARAFTFVTEKLPPAVPGRARRIRAGARSNATTAGAKADGQQRTDPRRAA